MNIQHSSRSDLWYTPASIIDRVRDTLGGIDLDPASDAYGNSRVMASSFINEEQDGLTLSWGTTPMRS